MGEFVVVVAIVRPDAAANRGLQLLQLRELRRGVPRPVLVLHSLRERLGIRGAHLGHRRSQAAEEAQVVDVGVR